LLQLNTISFSKLCSISLYFCFVFSIIYFAVESGDINEDFENITSTGQWTEERIRELEKSYHSYMQFDNCHSLSGEKVNGVSAIIP